MAKQPLSPDTQEFYNRPSKTLVTELLGHEIVTPAGSYVILQTEGFHDLVRQSMINDFESREREPGTVCVTNFRGWPQFNVVGHDRSGKPQLTWVTGLQSNEGKDASCSSIVRDMAEQAQVKVKEPADVVEFAQSKIDGKQLWKQRASVHIKPATDVFLRAHRRSHIAYPEKGDGKGTAKNSIGVGVLGHPFETGTSADQLKEAVEQEAARIGMKYEDVLDPANLSIILKKSSLLARIIVQLSQE